MSLRFKAELECERIVVVSVKTSHQVATYRTTELSDEFVQQKGEMSRRATIMSDKSEWDILCRVGLSVAQWACVAQWVKVLTLTLKVAGSSPTVTNMSKTLYHNYSTLSR